MELPKLTLVIAGAEKAGTSSLKEYIGQHPDICVHWQTDMMYFADSEEYRLGQAAAWRRYFGHRSPGQVLAA